jgi:hypothetical protein
MPMKKKSFICFEMVKEGQNFEIFFFVFSNKKENNKYVQNILLALFFNDKSS